jgi:hypothetical protein
MDLLEKIKFSGKRSGREVLGRVYLIVTGKTGILDGDYHLPNA